MSLIKAATTTAIAFVLYFPTLSFGANWVVISTSDEQEQSIDTDSIFRSPTTGLRVWLKINYLTNDKIHPQTREMYFSELVMFSLDCREQTISTEKYIIYKGANGYGRALESYTNKDRDIVRSAVVPNSVGENVMDFTCKYAKKNKI